MTTPEPDDPTKIDGIPVFLHEALNACVTELIVSDWFEELPEDIQVNFSSMHDFLNGHWEV